MKIHVLDTINFEINIDTMLEKMNLDREKQQTEQIVKKLLEGAELAAPKALYGEAEIQERGEESLTAEGICFTSRVLQVNTKDTGWLFPFLATCGRELEAWSEAQESPLERYVASLVEEEACFRAMEKVFETIDSTHNLLNPSAMNPGSLEDWPLSEQHRLFQLFQDSHKAIGIQLMDSLLMKPAKSMSGIRFSSTHSYTNCQLCSRNPCPGRLEPYDPECEERYRK